MTSSPDNPPISPRTSGQSIEALVARIEAPSRPEPLWTIERACCCGAGPMVKVLMPPVRPGGEPVDLQRALDHIYSASLYRAGV